MEWLIPIQTFQVEHVQLGLLTRGPKPMIPLGYKDADCHFPSLSFLLPSLTIKSYDMASGRLIISLHDSPQTFSKLHALQEMLLSAVAMNSLIPIRKGADMRAGFQQMVHPMELTLYCPAQETLTQAVLVYSKGVWQRGVHAGVLLPGTRVRIALRIQGVSFHIHPTSAQWTGKFRFQHKILSVMVVKPSSAAGPSVQSM